MEIFQIGMLVMFYNSNFNGDISKWAKKPWDLVLVF